MTEAPSSSSIGPSGGRSNRGGRGQRGRGRGSKGKSRGGRNGGRHHHHSGRSRGRGGRGRGRGGRHTNRGGGGDTRRGTANAGGGSNGMENLQSEEDVMIEFMYHLRKGDPVATKIHLEYGGNRKAFTDQARMYLIKLRDPNDGNGAAPPAASVPPPNVISQQQPQRQQPPPMSPIGKHATSSTSPSTSPFSSSSAQQQQEHQAPPTSPYTAANTHLPTEEMTQDADMEQMVANLTIVDDDDDEGEGKEEESPSTTTMTSAPRVPPGLNNKNASLSPTPLSTPDVSSPTNPSSSKSSTSRNTATEDDDKKPPTTTTSTTTAAGTTTTPPTTTTTATTTSTPPPKWQPKRLWTRLKEQPGSILANQIAASKVNGDGSANNTNPPPRLHLGPRSELMATWSLPLGYLRERTLAKVKAAQDKAKAAAIAAEQADDSAVKKDRTSQNNSILQHVDPEKLTIRDALRSLTVGLFRRGCTENGSNSAIIAKEVVPAHASGKTDGGNSSNGHGHSGSTGGFHFEIDHRRGLIWGNVPFYTPRTPGNVVLRLYFEDDALYTLATSACIRVVIREIDLEPTLRFILSNFKSRKGTTNFSSIHSLAAVLDQYRQSRNGVNGEGAGRAAWGCICESKKIVEASKHEFTKKKLKSVKAETDMIQIKEENEERWKEENEADEKDGKVVPEADASVDGDSDSEIISESRWRDRMNVIMGERASYERKWREVQSSFASVLRAVVMNNDASVLLKRDLVTKLKCEYSLWCSLCECFAENPFESNNHNENDNRSAYTRYPYPVTNKHFEMCKEKRTSMQMEALGFVPKAIKLDQVKSHDRSNELSKLSASMEKFYQEKYTAPSMTTMQIKEMARELTERAVSLCESFPKGTRVVVFGSSANGFGSPESDLDMCLQLPPHVPKLADEDDTNGSSAMGELAQKLEKSGMLDVDTSRLTARIAVVKFNCPVNRENGSNIIIECDVSMQNPLACVNTALLRSYSLSSPTVRILASIIKRWAKSRNINDPANHTLSSYGYILMLLHFLTTHKATNTGLPVQIFSDIKSNVPTARCPLVPNLQWMDQRWLQSQPGTPYQEWEEKPSNQFSTMPHPTEASYMVNTYFCGLNDQTAMTGLQRQMTHSNNFSCSLSMLLAAFFRFYAYDFDYKKQAVSLNASRRYGRIERESKAETDMWKSYGQALCIEDPFESFYDVAHVLKPLNFQRTRREFALAFSKISDAATKGISHEESLLDHICEDIRKD